MTVLIPLIISISYELRIDYQFLTKVINMQLTDF